MSSSLPNIVSPFQEQVRGILTQQIAKLGHAPSKDALASILQCSIQEVEDALVALHASHSLLLHPHKIEPWVVHPFALYPASCWVQVVGTSTTNTNSNTNTTRGYWATCLYCALGISAALKENVDIYTRFGGEAQQCIVHVRDQDILEDEKGWVFHLPTPVREWWDNVIHSCASFQPFQRESDVDDWCRRHGSPRGAVVPLHQMWRFASAWYGDYVGKPWHKRSASEIQTVLRSNDLTGPFWGTE